MSSSSSSDSEPESKLQSRIKENKDDESKVDKKRKSADDSSSSSSAEDSERRPKKHKKHKRKKREKGDAKERKAKKRLKKEKKEKKRSRDKRPKDKDGKADTDGSSPTGFKMSAFFDADAAASGEYSAISGKRIKRSIEVTDADRKSEARRLKRLEKLNEEMGGDDRGTQWGSQDGKFDPTKLKDSKAQNLLKNMQLVNNHSLSRNGFNPQAEAAKSENACHSFCSFGRWTPNPY